MNYEAELKVIYQKNLPDFPTLQDPSWSKEKFIALVQPRIEMLLNEQFASLVQIMYRIDVSEKDFALTLQPSNKKPAAEAIAELIFDRLILKAKIRAKYNNNNA